MDKEKLFKKLKFYPDFILINNKTKEALIIEIKGNLKNDIDKNTGYKINQINSFKNDISNTNLKVYFYL